MSGRPCAQATRSPPTGERSPPPTGRSWAAPARIRRRSSGGGFEPAVHCSRRKRGSVLLPVVAPLSLRPPSEAGSRLIVSYLCTPRLGPGSHTRIVTCGHSLALANDRLHMRREIKLHVRRTSQHRSQITVNHQAHARTNTGCQFCGSRCLHMHTSTTPYAHLSWHVRRRTSAHRSAHSSSHAHPAPRKTRQLLPVYYTTARCPTGFGSRHRR